LIAAPANVAVVISHRPPRQKWGKAIPVTILHLPPVVIETCSVSSDLRLTETPSLVDRRGAEALFEQRHCGPWVQPGLDGVGRMFSLLTMREPASR